MTIRQSTRARAASSAAATTRSRRAARISTSRQGLDRRHFRPRRSRRTGIPSLKVGFNQVFGYYIEITHTHANKVPERLSAASRTLKNAERYITAELKEYEEKVLNAEEKIKQLRVRLVRAACASAWRRRRLG